MQANVNDNAFLLETLYWNLEVLDRPNPTLQRCIIVAIDEHLERIRADIDNPEPYLVFSDWLQEQGNPWGELIALQFGLGQGDSSVASKII